MNKSKIAFDYNDYMTIEALEDNVEISLTRVSEYGINGIGWTKYKNKIVVNSGDFVSIKDTLNKGEAYGNISINGKCNLRGNCNSLIFGDYASSHNDLSEYYNCFRELLRGNSGVQEVDSNFLPATILSNWCYYNMFVNCTSLTSAPELPATTLAQSCYDSMFQGCSSLATAPELPATTLAQSCYIHMFVNCTSLTTAPELPATTLAIYCYDGMFSNCTSLTTAPELPATTLANSCYDFMFQGCSSLATAPELPATTLANSCYYYMFFNCTSLTTAPELPATTLADWCYNNMFRGCTKLNYIKMLATDISATNCLSYWVSGVASTGTFVKNPDATWDRVGVDGVPSGWTVKFDGEESGGSDGPITFTVKNAFGVISSYTIPHSMTWEEFERSEYNPVNEIGDKYFRNADGIIQYAFVSRDVTPDGEEYWTEYAELRKEGFTGVAAMVFSYEYISGEINFRI